jgi:hypothetical protein
MNTMNQRTTLTIITLGIPLLRNRLSYQQRTRPGKEAQKTNRRHLDIELGVRPGPILWERH